jgi:hypothetical protein
LVFTGSATNFGDVSLHAVKLKMIVGVNASALAKDKDFKICQVCFFIINYLYVKTVDAPSQCNRLCGVGPGSHGKLSSNIQFQL